MALNQPPIGYTGEDQQFSGTSQTKPGITRAATQAEVTTGTRSDIYVSPLSLATRLDGAVNSTSVTLTSAQVLALRATPITVIAAPGAGKTIAVDRVQLKLNYGGTNAFTNPQNLNLKYTNGSGVAVCTAITGTGFIDQTADTYTNTVAAANAIVAATGAENQAIVIHNVGGSEITGNAGDDNTVVVTVFYAILTQ